MAGYALYPANYAYARQSNPEFIQDEAGLFSEEQISTISELCWKIKRDHGLEIYFRAYDGLKESPSITILSKRLARRIMIKIDNASQKVEVLSASGIDGVKEKYFDRVAFQWIEENLSNRNHYNGTLGALYEIDQNFKRDARISQILDQFDEEEFTPNGRNALTIIIVVLLAFLIYQTVQGTRPGNYYENVQDYGISRMPRWAAVATGISLAILSVLFFNDYIFYYEELAVVLIAMVFAFWPFLVIACRIVMFGADLWTISKLASGDDRYSLAQKSFLVGSKVKGENLLELNFYELVIRKYILLEFVETRHSYHTSISVMVTKSPNIDVSKLPGDHIPFMDAFRKEEMNLQDYLHSLYTEVFSFKAYKKDYVALELLKKGKLTKLFWLFNFFRTSDSPEKNVIQSVVQKIEETLQSLAQEVRQGKESLIEKLSAEALLVKDFERKIDTIFNNFATNGELGVLQTSKLGPIFHEKFSFDQFNRKLAKSYKTSGQSWDWTIAD